MKYLDLLLNSIAPNHCLGCRNEGAVCCQKCLEEIKDLAARKSCYLCNRPCPDKGICSRCRPIQSLDSVSWYSDYANPLASRLVKSLKFNNLYASSGPIARGLSMCANTNKYSSKDLSVLITHAPTAGKRSRDRGWDQSRLIAKRLAKISSKKHRTLLIRSSSFDQIGSTRRDRIKSSKHFYRAHRKALINNSIIFLVDDVITTGSTLNSAARALKEAGAKEVYGLAFAHQGLRAKE